MMSSPKSAIEKLKLLTLDFANKKNLSAQELKKNIHWQQIMELPFYERYHITIIILTGLLQKRDPGYGNRLWLSILEEDLTYLLSKENWDFIEKLAHQIQQVSDCNTLPFSICWDVLKTLKKTEYREEKFFEFLNFFLKKHTDIEIVSERFREFILKIENEFNFVQSKPSEKLERKEYYLDNDYANSKGKYKKVIFGKYFIKGPNAEVAWEKLEDTLKDKLANYEHELVNNRSLLPIKQWQKQTTKAIADCDLSKVHKEALLASFTKQCNLLSEKK